jgi:hypothetical protein
MSIKKRQQIRDVFFLKKIDEHLAGQYAKYVKKEK